MAGEFLLPCDSDFVKLRRFGLGSLATTRRSKRRQQKQCSYANAQRKREQRRHALSLGGVGVFALRSCLQISGGNHAVRSVMDRRKQLVARNGFLETREVIDLGWLAGIGDDFVQLPALGHFFEYGLDVRLRLRDLVCRYGQYRVEP